MKDLLELIRFPLMRSVPMTRQEWADLKRGREVSLKPIGGGKRLEFRNWRELRL